MKTNHENIFAMLNEAFRVPTHEEPEIRPYNSRPSNPHTSDPRKPVEKESLTIKYRVVNGEFEVVIPEDMTVGGMVACLLATCKYLCNELDLDEKEVSNQMTEMLMKMLLDQTVIKIKGFVSEFFRKGVN